MPSRPLVRWWSLAFAIAVTLLVMFFAASAAGLSLLEDPTPLFRGARPLAGVIGVGLLIADVFLPIPSSLVMTLHGALFGVAGGAALSLLGSTLSALTGFAVGRAGNDAIRRLVTPAEHARAGALLERWGVVAIAVTRPVPILAETVAILAGSSPLTWRQTAVAAFAGSIAPAFMFAWAGSHATSMISQVWMFLAVIAVSGLLWLVGRKMAQPAGAA
ncbi:MAG: hypothetical protein QOH21_710 [Acidobacteriota bacterium]|jgi:uncharacterized membrane protein YdjX (TVP38/TMEM64 family)|nr:hypothetical protein [Acidobacteriota bacterium]